MYNSIYDSNFSKSVFNSQLTKFLEKFTAFSMSDNELVPGHCCLVAHLGVQVILGCLTTLPQGAQRMQPLFLLAPGLAIQMIGWQQPRVTSWLPGLLDLGPSLSLRPAKLLHLRDLSSDRARHVHCKRLANTQLHSVLPLCAMFLPPSLPPLLPTTSWLHPFLFLPTHLQLPPPSPLHLSKFRTSNEVSPWCPY